jgi:hypothetical protein
MFLGAGAAQHQAQDQDRKRHSCKRTTKHIGPLSGLGRERPWRPAAKSPGMPHCTNVHLHVPCQRGDLVTPAQAASRQSRSENRRSAGLRGSRSRSISYASTQSHRRRTALSQVSIAASGHTVRRSLPLGSARRAIGPGAPNHETRCGRRGSVTQNRGTAAAGRPRRAAPALEQAAASPPGRTGPIHRPPASRSAAAFLAEASRVRHWCPEHTA